MKWWRTCNTPATALALTSVRTALSSSPSMSSATKNRYPTFQSSACSPLINDVTQIWIVFYSPSVTHLCPGVNLKPPLCVTSFMNDLSYLIFTDGAAEAVLQRMAVQHPHPPSGVPQPVVFPHVLFF